MKYTINFRDIWAQQEFLLEGIRVTLMLSAVTMAFGLIIGAVAAAMRVYGGCFMRAISAGYVEIIRNTPLIVQLFLVFFGLPGLGVRLDAMTASFIGLAINLGAYSAEILRAGLEAVPRSQIEAGHSLGLSGPQVFRHVVMFPALKVIYPALTGQFVLMMLATSVVSQISTPDLFHVASIIQSRTFRDFEIYLVVAVLYLLLALALRFAFLAIGQIAFGRR